jgi:hypothetical protein
VIAADPGRVLRLALLAWGLGHIASGRRATGAALLVLEAIALVALAILTLTLAGGTLDLIPFVAGLIFIGVWAAQAVQAYRAVRVPVTDDGQASRSPAAAVAWLSLPLLVWSSGFWLIAGDAASAPAVVDRFVSDWAHDGLADAGWPPWVRRAADRARTRLVELCADRALPDGCATGGAELLRGVRWRVDVDGDEAIAVAEVVRYERRSTTFLWVFAGTESVPVAIGEVLRLQLVVVPVAGPLPVDAREWQVRDAETWTDWG